jgi:hypothetical protein
MAGLQGDAESEGAGGDAVARCDNPAVTTEPHPLLGDVPICQRCADKVKLMSAT